MCRTRPSSPTPRPSSMRARSSDPRRSSSSLRRAAERAGLRSARASSPRTSRRPRRRGPRARVRRSTRAVTMEQHIRALWPSLTRPADASDPRSSLIPLPHPVRRARRTFSRGLLLGLVLHDARPRRERSHRSREGHARQLRASRHNRRPRPERQSLLLPRPQPAAVSRRDGGALRAATDTNGALRYLDALEREHDFWMDGASTARAGARRGGAWCGCRTARSSIAIGTMCRSRVRNRIARTTRSRRRCPKRSARRSTEICARVPRVGGISRPAGCATCTDLRTLEVIDLAPVDLNSLLYNSERTIAALRRHCAGRATRRVADRYDSLATARRAGAARRCVRLCERIFLRRALAHRGARARSAVARRRGAARTFGLATEEQGRAVRRAARARLSQARAASSRRDSSRDSSGTRRTAGRRSSGSRSRACAATDARRLADTARARWLALNRRVYRATGKMTEKYDVVDSTRARGRRRISDAGWIRLDERRRSRSLHATPGTGGPCARRASS